MATATLVHDTPADTRTSDGTARMRAVVRTTYGGPEALRFTEVDTPKPGPGEVRVRVRASSVNFGDDALISGRPWAMRLACGLRRPRNPGIGLDFAGEIEALGPGVTDLALGDRVFGESQGAYARCVVAPVTKLARVPAGVDTLQAAAVPVAGVTALRAMEVAGVKPGHRVLINGASGGVGHFAVQIARHLGAEVTAVCSGRNRALVERLGAAHVVDYTTEDFTATDARYDAILDLVGSAPIRTCRRLLTPGGVYVASVGRLAWVLGAALSSLVDRRVKLLYAEVRAADLDRLGALLAEGAVRADIEREWPMQALPDAIRHQRSGRTRGKCVVRIE